MTSGARIPRSDVARISRVVTAFEARGEAGSGSEERRPRPTADLRAVLLGSLVADLSTGDTRAAPAVPLQHVGDPCFVLRVAPGDGRPFRLKYAGQSTPDLNAAITAGELLSRLQGFSTLAGQVSVVGLGDKIGSDAVPWSIPLWFIRVKDDGGQDILLDPLPENHAVATISRTLDWPTDRIEHVYARFAGDEFVNRGAIVACRVDPGVGYRVWSAALQVEKCPPQNAIIRVLLHGPPTAGTWSLTIAIPADDPDTEQTETELFLISDLAWNCTEADLQAAIDAVPELAGKIVVTFGPAHQAAFNLEFIEELGHQPIPLPSINWAGLEGVIVSGSAYYAQLGRADKVLV